MGVAFEKEIMGVTLNQLSQQKSGNRNGIISTSRHTARRDEKAQKT